MSKIIPCLLRPGISPLSADIIAVYLQAVTKVFGSWSAGLAEQWESDDLPQIKDMVTTIIIRFTSFVNSPYIEVQERVICLPFPVKFSRLITMSGRKLSPTVQFHPSRLEQLQT